MFCLVGDPDFRHLRFGKGGTPRTFSPRDALRVVLPFPRFSMRHTSLTSRIRSVVSACAKKQMRGIHAIFDITVMANKQTVGDITKGKYPRNSMCRNRLSTNGCKREYPIPRRSLESSPQPTTIGIGCFVNILQKSGFWMGFSQFACTFYRTANRFAQSIGLTVTKFFTAYRAGRRNLGDRACALGLLGGIITAHGDLLHCVTPPAVPPARGLSVVSIIPQGGNE
jgi:hypothetical protein